jgi:hypothetical protein
MCLKDHSCARRAAQSIFARVDEETVLAISGELERVMKLGADPFIFLI